MNTSLRGTIKLDEHVRTFEFKDKILFIHPSKSEYDFFDSLLKNEHKHYELIIGKTYDNHLIYFLDVTVLNKNDKYYAYPLAYTVINCNTIDWDYDIFNFKDIKLKSNAVDSLQNAEYSHKIKQYFIKNEHDSDIDIIRKGFEITQGKCELVTGYNIISRDIDTSINVSSNLNIILNEETSIYDVYQLVNKINEVFKFVFNRANIAFSSIKLETESIKIMNDFDGTTESDIFQATMYILNQTNEFKARNINQISDHILKKFNSLMKVVNKEIISYYPKNDKDFHYVDVEKFIKVCGTFEREFENCFPKWLPTNETDYDNIKQELIKFLDELDVQFNGKNTKARKAISSFKYTVNNMNEKLEKRLKFAFNKFAYCLKPRFEKYCKNVNLKDTNINKIFSCFANKRNKYVHTFNDLGFTQEEIAGFVIVREMIYCMILKQAEFTEEEITEMINLFQ